MPRTRKTRPQLLAESSYRAPDGCLIWIGPTNEDGYGVICFIREDGKRTSTGAHKAAFLEAGGTLLPGQVVMHATCHRPACIEPTHLRAGSQLRNIRERKLTGTASHRGGPRPKKNEVAQRLAAMRSGITAREFSQIFGIGINASFQWMRRWQSRAQQYESTQDIVTTS